MKIDSYKTVLKTSKEIIYKEKKSKFYSCVFPINSKEEVKSILEKLKKKHHTANHICYAWQLGTDSISYRTNDDGEPNNSAGMPIYGQIKAFNLTNVLVSVVRIFGGTKLGVGGLIKAYKTSAQLVLNSAEIIEKIIENSFQLHFSYSEMDKVMRIIKYYNLTIVSQKMEASCKLTISVRKSKRETIEQLFNEIYGVSISKIL